MSDSVSPRILLIFLIFGAPTACPGGPGVGSRLVARTLNLARDVFSLALLTPIPPEPSPTLWRHLVDRHLHYVRVLARRERLRLGGQVELDELIAYGALGLVDAARRFERERGLSFLTFAHHRIRGAMLDGLRQLEGGPRRPPGTGSEDRLRPARCSESMDDFPGSGTSQEELLLGVEAHQALHRALLRLPVREQHLLRACYFDGQTLDQAGARLGLSRSWVCRLHARAVQRLRRELKGA